MGLLFVCQFCCVPKLNCKVFDRAIVLNNYILSKSDKSTRKYRTSAVQDLNVDLSFETNDFEIEPIDMFYWEIIKMNISQLEKGKNKN